MLQISPRRAREAGSSPRRNRRRRQGTGPRMCKQVHDGRRHHATEIMERMHGRVLHPHMPRDTRKVRTTEVTQQQTAEVPTRHAVGPSKRARAPRSEPPHRRGQPGRGHTQVTGARGGDGEQPRRQDDHRRHSEATQERHAPRQHMDVATTLTVGSRAGDGRIRLRGVGAEGAVHTTRMRNSFS